MHRLEIHTFGGFEIRRGDRRLTEFESRKVEALGAYLVAHRGHGVSRDHLASLLWPERPEASGRRNLRQALYNLRSTIEGDGPARFVVDGRSVRFEPEPLDWIDLDPFERMLLPEDGVTAADPRELASAVRLYRGEFLAGVTVPGLGYEEWLLAEQERYREAALRALHDLMEHALATGDHETGIRYARRLVRVDPLNEEAHRGLIRLYALSGRRGRALAHYEELAELLDRELGVAPLEETSALYRAVRNEEGPLSDLPEAPEPTGPVLPLVGREETLATLEAPWRAVAGGRGGITLLCGEEGVGKTRVLKTFLHATVSTPGATVLQGSWFELEPPMPYRGILEAFDNLLVHELDAVERLIEGSAAADLARLARLVPRLRRLEGGPQLHAAIEDDGTEAKLSPAELAGVLGRTLGLVGTRANGDGRPPEPVVLVLEDLQWADRSSLELLAELASTVADLPVWVVATMRPGSAAEKLLADRPEVAMVPIDPLTEDDLATLAETLVGSAEAPPLTSLLVARTGGNALHASTLVNLLWDLEVLEPVEDGGWYLHRDLASVELPPGTSCDDGAIEALVHARLDRLPPSARRLLTLAAVAGPRFEPALLGAIEGEEEVVVEAALRTLLERWLVRLFLGYWADSRRDRDMVLWAGGARRGTFELSHGAVRRTVYRALDPARRRALHGKVAAALELPPAPPEQVAPEILAHHHLAAGAPVRGAALLLQAAERADLVGAATEAAYARDLAATVADTASSQPPATAPAE